MEFKTLERKRGISPDKKLSEGLALFEKLINELKKKEVPLKNMETINRDIDGINSFSGSDKDLLSYLKKTQSRIITTLEKELKLVPKIIIVTYG